MKRQFKITLSFLLPIVAVGIGFISKANAATPDEVALRILAHSPRVVVTSAETFAAEQDLLTSSNLTDPEIEGEYLFAPSGESNRWGAGISWGLEWPGVYASRRKAAAGNLQALQAEEMVERTKVLTEIGNLLLDYILESKKLALFHELKEANDSVGALARRSFSGGETTRLDLAKLKVESASLVAKIAEAESARGEAEVSLSEIYGEDCSGLLSDMMLEFPCVIVPTKGEIEVAMNASPEVIAAWCRLEEARLNSKVVAREGLPSISIGYRHAYEDGIHFNGASLGLSIPIFSGRGKKNAAKVKETLSELNLEVIKNQVGQSLNGGCRRLADMNRNIDMLAGVLDFEEELVLLEKAYKGGMITLIDYINERNYFLEARLDLLQLRHSASRLRLTLHSLLPNRL